MSRGDRARAAALAALGLAACASPAAKLTTPFPVVAPRAAPATRFRYEVVAGPGGRDLAIEAVIPKGACAELAIDEASPRFMSDVECAAGGPFVPVPRSESPDGAVWRLPPCPDEGCRVRYRFALDAAARSIGDVIRASREAGAIVTSPTSWLLAPTGDVEGLPFTLRVTTPPGVRFVSGLLPNGSGEYTGDISDLARAPFSAIGEMRVHTGDAGGETVDVAILPGGAFDLEDAALVGWTVNAARAVRDYYGRAPIRRVLVVIAPTRGSGWGYGRTLGNGGASIFVPLGRSSTRADLEGGWEMIHEMLHVAFPNLPREQAWFEEGMATYVEPILRARLGLVTADHSFARLRKRMPFGLPDSGDQGLDRTPTWGRTYWGGAMFCLLADVEIRRRTENRRSLDDALRGIVAAGGNVASRWDVERTIAVGDQATGVPVLTELYARLGHARVDVPLDRLWQRLGVVGAGDGVTFDDAAPLAAIRRAIVAKRQNEPIPAGLPSVMP